MTYDPSDRSRDSARVDALAVLLTRLADAETTEGTMDPWAHLCAWRKITDKTLAFGIVMPVRCGESTHCSTLALMDPEFDGKDARYYATPEETVRALLDNIVFELYGPSAPTAVQLRKAHAGDDRARGHSLRIRHRSTHCGSQAINDSAFHLLTCNVRIDLLPAIYRSNDPPDLEPTTLDRCLNHDGDISAIYDMRRQTLTATFDPSLPSPHRSDGRQAVSQSRVATQHLNAERERLHPCQMSQFINEAFRKKGAMKMSIAACKAQRQSNIGREMIDRPIRQRIWQFHPRHSETAGSVGSITARFMR